MEYTVTSLCFFLIGLLSQTGYALRQAGALRFKYLDNDMDDTDVGAKFYLILETDRDATGYIMKPGAPFASEPYVPIIKGDPDYEVWNMTAPYVIDGGNSVLQYISTFINHNGYDMENYLVAAHESGSMVNSFYIDSFIMKKNEPSTGSRFSILSCPQKALELDSSSVSLRVEFTVDTTENHKAGGLLFTHYQSVRDRFGILHQKNTPVLYDKQEVELHTARSRVKTHMVTTGSMAQRLNITTGPRGRRTRVTATLTLSKVGLYSLSLAEGHIEAMAWGDEVICNVQVTNSGQQSWYDKRVPEVDIGGELAFYRKERSETPRVQWDGSYIRCSAAGRPLPDVQLVFHGQCDPHWSCPASTVIAGPFLASYRTMPDVVETIYFFSYEKKSKDFGLGWYTCRATNEFGTGFEHFELVK